MQVILAQVAYDLPIQDGCSWHRVSSAVYNGLLGQRASYAAICETQPHLHRYIHESFTTGIQHNSQLIRCRNRL